MKTKLFCLLLLILSNCTFVIAQMNPRLCNDNYKQTFFFDFNGELDRNIWNVQSNWKRDATYSIWVDGLTTVNTSNGNLNLSMISSPGYFYKITEDSFIYADYISGEIFTKQSFSYGTFECRAKLAYGRGSFPAFWVKSGLPCSTSTNNEIDIVELVANNDNSTLDNNIWYYLAPCGDSIYHKYKKRKYFFLGRLAYLQMYLDSYSNFVLG